MLEGLKGLDRVRAIEHVHAILISFAIMMLAWFVSSRSLIDAIIDVTVETAEQAWVANFVPRPAGRRHRQRVRATT
ncbi:hypothetical protein ACQP1K_03315 [Sphaerimonospora sp. CA-214678]|uniref:hypothetical protein n=1 Tax=Sphaerimonospora sp. CA-214678 TaxID=3240029 RepID=UPI003D8D9E6E